MRILKFLFIGALFFVACNDAQNKPQQISGATTKEELIKNGETIFNTNCTMCHAINAESSTGMAPILDSVKYNWTNKEELAKYLKNAKENLNINEHIKAVSEKWKNKVQMPTYNGLSDYDVESLITYLNYVSK